MSYPILEFDETREAFIEPSKIIHPRDVAEHCVITFFKDVVDKIISAHHPKVIARNRWEDGPHPLYEIEYQGQRLAFLHSGVGAPLASSLLEEIIAMGCRKFMVCGGCGVLAPEFPVGYPVVVSEALRDEGVSYHYLPPSRTVKANSAVLKLIIKELEKRGIPHQVGKTWTTDAPYRETPNKIAARREEGCLTVEMEAAGLMAVAEFRKVLLGQILYSGDDLSGGEWDKRDWQTYSDIREQLFWLCADICLQV